MNNLASTIKPQLLRDDLTNELAAALHAVPRIAWDIETSGLDWRVEQIGTCQLHAPEVGTVIVQINGTSPNRLRGLLADPAVLKVFHHAPFDLRFMAAQWGLMPKAVACTKIASKLLDPHAAKEAHSLQALLRRQLGIHISKAERLSNWLLDDLSPDQLAYAAADVTHLLTLLDSLEKELANAGLADLYEQCTEFLPARVRLDIGSYPDVFAY